MSDTYTVLACDPGTANFATSVITATKIDDRLKFKIHGTRIMDSTVRDLKGNVGFSLKNFTRDFDSIIEALDLVPDHLIMERFQSRGMKGTTIECINFMLGCMIFKYHEDTDVTLIPAVTWKNRANKKIDLKGAYKRYNLHRVITKKTAHELDSTLIGMYACYKHFEIEDFKCFDRGEESLSRFMEYFESVPTLNL